MSPVNVRTVNGAKHNGHLPLHYQRIQNRAAAVLDAWDEFGESVSIDLIAHMHRIHVDQIKKDLYGDRIDIKKRFGSKSSVKLERVLERCIKEIEEGVDSALVAVAHNIPFMLIRDIQNSQNLKQVATVFLRNITASNDSEPKKDKTNPDFTTNAVHPTKRSFTRPTFSSIENQTSATRLIPTESHAHVAPSDFTEESVLFNKQRNISSKSTIIHSPSLDKSYASDANGCCNIETQEIQGTPVKRLKKIFHDTVPLTSSQLKMEWSITRVHGLGLTNTAPFVQWLLNDDFHNICTLTTNDEFCSCCILRSIIKSIHQSLHNTCDLFSELSQASGVSLARQMTKLSSNFIPGRQEDPSELLIVLFDHLIQCLSPINSSSYVTYLSNPIHIIFGINIKSSTKCTVCLNETNKQNYESVWSIPIISYFNLKQALDAFCSVEELAGDDMFFCSKCQTKVLALRSTKLIDASPVIFIHLKRFVYDKQAKIIRKIKQFISYPELLDFSSFITPEVLQSNKENHTFHQYIYQLNAVVVHIGETVNSGHIFSYVRSPDNLWYKADDASITKTNLDKVLADNDSYILCYSKLAEGNIIVPETEVYANCKEPSRLLFSSTPIRPYEKTYTTIEDHTTICSNFSLNISGFDDQSPKRNVRAGSSILNTSSLNLHESTSRSHSSLKENLSVLKTPLFPKNIAEPIECQTENSIDIVDNLIVSGTPSSLLNFQSQHTPLPSKRRVLFSNDSTQLSTNSTQSQPCSNSNIAVGSQLSMNVTDSQHDKNFNVQLSPSYQFKLQSIDLMKLKSIRATKINKKTARVFEAMGLPTEIDDKSQKKIFLSKQAKAIRGMMDKVTETPGNTNRLNCSFGVRTSNHNQLLRCILYCAGRPTCPFACSLIVINNGDSHIIVTNRTIMHICGKKICRPIREPIRSLIKKKFAHGATVYRVHQERLQKRTREEQKAYNYDITGKTQDILRKIKSEHVNESLLSLDIDQSILKLNEKFHKEINPDGKIKGAIQQISKYPCQIVVYTESSIRLFDTLLKHKNVVLSWDATGSVIQEKKMHLVYCIMNLA
ncbi:unnamed protein product [Rotaria sp. Silwood2]|nr:unnamed protein product [Rotaria sp. Silwood2]CAF4218026.1 unnamed protein product [Rotaria sp. Silwood2]CAF4291194.1 unnamed protein product [Rotaria sp. Silwood2]